MPLYIKYQTISKAIYVRHSGHSAFREFVILACSIFRRFWALGIPAFSTSAYGHHEFTLERHRVAEMKVERQTARLLIGSS